MTFKKGNQINLGKKNHLGHKHSIETIKQISKTKTKNPTKFWLGKKRPEMSGSNHPYYIDGRSKFKSPFRYGDDWDKIRKMVYERDHWTCQDCGIKGIKLDVHHKIPFLESHDNSLENLISLCRSCHIKRERKLTTKKFLSML